MPLQDGNERARPLSAARGAYERILRSGLDFSGRVYRKAGQDDIFFLAGGIAFNVLVGAIPFLLLLIAIFGFVLQATVDDPQQTAINYVIGILPPSDRVLELTRSVVDQLITGRTGIGVVGLVLLVWISTRLIGSLRSALRDIFDVQEDRGIIAGKIFDAKMVVVAGSLFVANTGITVALETVNTRGAQWLGLGDAEPLRAFQALWAQLLAFAFIFAMFVLIYRFLPARRINWRIALVAGTFTAVVFEILKSVFAWYVAHLANYTTTYGYLATIVVLVFWIYYSAVVFVLGGEVGQVYELYRIRRTQREVLE
ncbi:MAG TPA: YihY/virulence factor BrkB family protein [Longimicrobiaceae bacterium]|nr:YihY/virulence factor BrkB family protein [Longimicrobiaceae bacterium]